MFLKALLMSVSDSPVRVRRLYFMACSWLMGICLLVCIPASAQILDEDTVFLSSFEGETIPPLFPRAGGEFQLPSNPTTDQLAWLLSELDAGENTTTAEVQAHFVPGFDPVTIRDFINDVLRVSYPNATIIDVIGVTPVMLTAVIDGDSGPASSGFLQFGAEFTGTQLINFIQVSDFFGSVQFPDDMNLTLEQAVDEFQTLGTENSLFAGFINDAGQCEAIIERDSTTLRALGSVFKMWVLGGVASDIEGSLINRGDNVTLVAAERAAGGTINNVPLGTNFSVQEMATLMMAISDNTATDHLHELVGRDLIGNIVQLYGVNDPDILLPFLNISEQFHVFTRFDLPTANSYVNGTEMFQEQFLMNSIEPEGPSFPVNFPFFHDSLLTDGSWRASAVDICQTLAGLRETGAANDAFTLVNEAMGSQSAQPGIRNVWDRVWYKGGSLESGATGLHVLANAWLLENSGEFPPFVVVALANNPAGGIDIFQVQSLTSRIVELMAGFEP